MVRIPIRLNDESIPALQILAEQEYRDIRQQAAWMIEHELERCGLLAIKADPPRVETSPTPAKEKIKTN